MVCGGLPVSFYLGDASLRVMIKVSGSSSRNPGMITGFCQGISECFRRWQLRQMRLSRIPAIFPGELRRVVAIQTELDWARFSVTSFAWAAPNGDKAAMQPTDRNSTSARLDENGRCFFII